MKPFAATLLAAALGLAFSSAHASDAATYRSLTQKASADYKLAAADCASKSGHERTICQDEAKVARARANADAVAHYNDTRKARSASGNALAHAEYALAKSKCAPASGAAKDSCLAAARTAHTAALDDVKADRGIRVAATAPAADPRAATTEPDGTVAANPSITQKAGDMAGSAVDKTKEVAANIADKTERAFDRAAGKTEAAGDKTGKVVADSVITTKVKADLFKEPELSAMSIHVETEKGVVMLSGFVDSKADADKAVQLAKSVEGVTQVKSAIQVK